MLDALVLIDSEMHSQRPFPSFSQDLKQWWFLADGMAPLPDSAWTQILAECGISDADAITAPQFEQVVDAVLARYEVV